MMPLVLFPADRVPRRSPRSAWRTYLAWQLFFAALAAAALAAIR